jgi:hypothetical protein
MRTILFLTMLFALINAWGQTTAIEYQYDEAGNRKLRKVITLQLKSATMPDSILSSDVISGKDFTIYPNPTEGMLSIRIDGLDGDESVLLQISDLKGRVLISEKETAPFRTIDLTMHPLGMYILTATLGNERREWKIIKK